MALRLRNPRVRLHKYPFISIIYHNLTLHIIMSGANSTIKIYLLKVCTSAAFLAAVKYSNFAYFYGYAPGCNHT